MEDEEVKSIGDYLGVLRRRKRQFMLPTLVLFLITLAVALGLPAVYRSAATILIEKQDIPEDLVRSTITTYADQRIQIIQQRVMTTTNLMKIVNKYGLYEDELKKETREEVLERMREEDVEFEMLTAEVMDPRSGRPMTASIAFMLAFNSESPALAQKVANELVSLYLNENLRSRKEKTAETSGFLIDEAKRISDLIALYEKRLADYKEENANMLPELLTMNMNLLQRSEQELLGIESQQNSLEERRIYLESELAQLEPYTATLSSSGKPILGVESRLKEAEAVYTTLSATYGPDHPDIIKIIKQIESLKKEAGGKSSYNEELHSRLETLNANLAIIREQYSEDHPDAKKLVREIANLENQISAEQKKPASGTSEIEGRKPNNPAYINIKTNLDRVDIELKGLDLVRPKIEKKLREYEDRIMKTPQIEREYHSLVRDYDSAVYKYREMRAKNMEAKLAEQMEKGSKGERFSLIEPPILPEKPDKPNRLLIIFLGLVLSIASGIGAVSVAESMDHSVRGDKRIASILGAMPLATIPYIIDEEDVVRKKKSRMRFLLIMLIAIVLTLVALHFMFKPLDVLWYVLMRKLDIMLF